VVHAVARKRGRERGAAATGGALLKGAQRRWMSGQQRHHAVARILGGGV
jgi:hypothetical protein